MTNPFMCVKVCHVTLDVILSMRKYRYWVGKYLKVQIQKTVIFFLKNLSLLFQKMGRKKLQCCTNHDKIVLLITGSRRSSLYFKRQHVHLNNINYHVSKKNALNLLSSTKSSSKETEKGLTINLRSNQIK